MIIVLTFTFYVDAEGHLICLIKESIKEVMPLQTAAVSGATPSSLLFQSAVPGQRPTQIGIFPSSHL